MYKRLDAVTCDKLMQRYLSDRYFQLLLPALRDVAEQYDELNPVEVWDEAMEVINRLVVVEGRRDLAVLQIRQTLLSRYGSFRMVEGREKCRSTNEAKRTADMVLTVVEVLLSGASKESEANPHSKTIASLASTLKGSPTMRYIMNKAEADEEAEERCYGEIPEHDYLRVEDELSGPREMLRKAGTCAADGKQRAYDRIVDELLENDHLAAMILGGKTLQQPFNAKCLCMVLGMIFNQGLLKGSNASICKALGKTAWARYLSPQENMLPDELRTTITTIIKKYK